LNVGSIRKMEEDNVICTVRAKRDLLRHTFSLTPDCLVWEWISLGKGRKGRKIFPLNTLSPRLNHRSEFAHGSFQCLRKAVLFLGLAICLWFSELNRQIPLLAPFLLVLGSRYLIIGLHRFRHHNWTVIDKKSGERALLIPHTRANGEELATFEKEYVDMINKHQRVTPNQALQRDPPRRAAEPER